MTSYLMVTVMFAISLTVFEIFAKQDKCRNFHFENDDQGIEEKDLCHSTKGLKIRIGELLSEF